MAHTSTKSEQSNMKLAMTFSTDQVFQWPLASRFPPRSFKKKTHFLVFLVLNGYLSIHHRNLSTTFEIYVVEGPKSTRKSMDF